jgi:hypothetical protein
MSQDLTLGTIAQAEELWQHGLRKILENIEDPNTGSRDAREIVLKFKFTADDDRRVGGIQVSCSTKLAGIRAAVKQVYYGKRNGQLVIVPAPTQESMFPESAGRSLQVVKAESE